MKFKMGKIVGLIVTLGIVFNINNVFGVQKLLEVQAAINTEAEEKNVLEVRLPIAIVNLDEGIIQDEKKINYGVTLTKSLENVKVTNLEDARQGIEEGVYRGYLIIPNTFSERVMTVEGQPLKSTVQYAIATDLKVNERDRTLTDIVNMYNTLSNDLGRIYMSSLLKEYHAIQDATNEIMKRDTLDMEKLLEVNGYDLVSIIEVPEMKVVDKNVSFLDIQIEFGDNSAQLNNISAAYSTSARNGKEGLDIVLANKANVTISEGDSRDKIDAALDTVGQIVNPNPPQNGGNNTPIGEATYDGYKDKIVGTDGIIDKHNKSISKFNDAVNTQYAQSNAVENEYSNFVANLSSIAGGTIVAQDSIMYNANGDGIDAGRTQFSIVSVATINSYKDDIRDRYALLLDTLINNAAMTPSQLLGVNIAAGDIDAYKSYVENTIMNVSSVNVSGTTIDVLIPNATIAPPTVEIEGVFHSELPDVDIISVKDEVDNIINIKNQDLNTLQQAITAIDVAYSAESAVQGQLDNDLKNFNIQFQSYVDTATTEAATHEGKIQENNSSILEKATKNSLEYDEYANEVYAATNENIDALKQKISEGQEESNKKLEEGLAAAKASREENSKNNFNTLQGFSTRLSYTRMGEQENKTVYDFIVDPILLENKSEPAVETLGVENITVAKKGSDTFSREIPLWVWLTVIGGLVVVVSAIGIGKLIVYKRRDEF